jgi:hypothetical protein
MTRTIASLCLTAVVVLGTACARQAGSSTTTVTSGSTSGVRVTGVRTDPDEAGLRLADEICNREVACSQIGDGTRYPTVEACMSDQGSRAPARLAHWSCTPSSTQASFETCLAAIRSEHCETKLANIDQLGACRTNAVCGR